MAFLLKKTFFNWFTKELQTTLKLIFVQKAGGRAPKHPETKGRGETRKKIQKEQEETEKQEISIIHTQE